MIYKYKRNFTLKIHEFQKRAMQTRSLLDAVMLFRVFCTTSKSNETCRDESFVAWLFKKCLRLHYTGHFVLVRHINSILSCLVTTIITSFKQQANYFPDFVMA